MVTLHLFINPNVTGDTTATICQNQVPFQWHGQSLTTANDYTTTLTSAAGCDSVVTLHLFINPNVTGDTTATICQNQVPFQWHGQSLTTANDYTTTLTSAAGCDSVVTLHLFINPNVTGDTTATICQNQVPFQWHGQSLTTANDYTTTLTSAAGCDSVVTLHLFINPNVTGDTTATICQNQVPFQWHGQSLTTANDYTTTLTSAAGCDSVVTLHLFINPNVTGDTTATICQNQVPFQWHGQSLTTANDYTTTLTSAAGCDSVVTLHLFINPNVTGDTTATICQNQVPFQWHGQSLTTANDYTTTLTSAAGCDSVVTLHLFINPNVTGDTTATICQNQVPFQWHGQSLTTANDYTTTLTSAAGCDSVVTLHLFINPNVTGDTTATICQNQVPFQWHGQSLTTANDYTTTLTSAAGCDSVVTLHLFINPNVTGDTTATICQNQVPFQWHGQSLTTANDYTTTLTSAAGCDSVVTLHLFINPNVTGDTTATICQNQVPFQWHGQSLTTANDYTTTLTSAAGCDSVVTLHLFINPNVTGDTTATICQNQVPFQWHGQSLTTANDYTTTLTSAAGCDSVVTLHLFINPNVTGDTTATICQNQVPFQWHGQSLTTANDYTTTLTSAAGCDSVVTLHLFINPNVTGDTTATICQNQVPFQWHGQSLTTANDYTTTLTSAAGCDSVVTLHLFINPNVTGDTTATICQNQVPFQWHGQSLTTANDYTTTLTSAAGCDSVVTLHLFINPNVTGDTTATICQNQVPFQWHGQSLTTANDYTTTLTSAAGCDSVVTLHLFINPNVTGDTTATICQNQVPFQWHGQSLTTANDYTTTLTSAAGCDSVVTLHLFINPNVTGDTTATICQNQVPFQWHGQSLTTANDYTTTLTSAAGCDSVVTLHLFINPNVTGDTTATICQNQVPFQWHGQSLTTANDYTTTLTSAAGCDSVVTLHLFINPNVTGDTTATICQNQVPFQWHGQSLTTANDYTTTLTSAAGCDSVVTLHLFINPNVTGDTTATICQNQVPFQWHGQSLTTANDYTTTLTSAAGCDSVVTLHLFINPNVTGDTTATICQNQVPFQWHGQSLTTANDYTTTLTSAAGCDSVVTLHLFINPNVTGDTTATICQNQVPFQWHGQSLTTANDYTTTLTSAAGCDSVVTLHLFINPNVTGDTTATICQNQVPFQWHGQSLTTANDYTTTLTSAAGCDSVVTLHLFINPNVTGDTTATICQNQVPFQWHGQSLTTANDYTTTLTSAAGCDSVVTLHLFINPNVTGDTTATICQNQVPFQWHGQSLTTANDYTTTLTSAAGCDSVVTLHLFINPNVTGDTTATICQNQVPFQWHGQSLTTANDYTTTLTSAAGCDSVVTLHLFINPNVTGDTTATICQNQVPFQWHGQSLTTANDYTTTLTSAAGCDSVVTLHLFINPNVTGDTTATICQNQVPFQWHGQSLTTANDYTTTLTSAAGCDSVVTLHLFINPNVTGDTTATICQNQVPFQWHGQSLTTANDYTTTLTSAAGCDSVVTLHLFINPNVTGDTTATICQNQVPFQWHGQSLTTANDYTTTLTSAAGCDSVVTLHLFINPNVTGDTTATICQNQVPFQWHGQSLTTANDYTTTLTSAAGCDSVVTLHLFINPNVTGDTTATICQNQVPFQWHGQSLTTANDYTTTLTSAAGCDSVVTLHLFINPNVTGDTTATICQNQVPFQWHGQSLTTANDYTTTLTSAAGCDSVVTLHLFINPNVTGDTTATICQNQVPFQWHGQSLTTANDYTTTLTSAAGCDSVVTLHLFINPNVTGDTTATICQNQVPFQWHGQSLTTANDYTTTLTSAAGCDSVVTLHLFINPNVTGDTTATICQNQVPFQWHGQSLTTANDYTTTLTSAAGCDSVVTLHLFINPNVTGDTTATICQNQVPFQWHGQSLTTANDYTTTLTSAAGCDSVVTLHLFINPNVTGDTTATICQNQVPFQWHGQSLTTANDYTTTLTSAAGCDSVVTLHLFINPNVTGDTTATICQNQVPFQWHGQSLTTANDYTTTLTSAAGCDSVVTLHLFINPNVTGDTTATICQNQVPFQWHGQSLTTANDYTTTLTSAAGCDSVVTLHLFINPNVTGDTTATICQNQVPFQWHGQSLTTANDYTTTLTSAAGCDSVVTLHLFINPNVTGDTTATICQNQVPFQWHGQSLTTANDYTTTLTSAAGCDSVVTLHLFINPNVTGDTTATICQNQVPFQWHGQSLTTANDYTTTLTSAAGCDSVVTLHLFINPNVTGDTTATICQNQVPFQWHGQSLTTANDYTTTLTSAAGCDSVVTLHLFINPNVTGDTTATICQNQVPFQWHGQSLTTANDYTTTLTSAAGCDSVVTLHLFINPNVTGDTTATICQNQVPFQWHGQSLTTANDYTTTLTSAAGCDSVVTLHLFINPNVTGDTTATICQNQVPFQWHGQSLTTANDYTTTLTSAAGCDSVVTLHLTINGGQHTDTLVTACKSYTWDRTGVEYTTTQDVDYIFTNAQGCQDTVTLKLTINGGQHTDTLVTACKSYTWDRTGVEYTTTQDVDYIFTNAQGCQDTVTLKLTINGGQHTDTLVTACKSYTWDRTGVEYTTTQDVDYIFTNAQGCQDTVTLKLTINGGQHTDTLVTACKSYTWDRTGVEYTTTQDVDYIFTNAQGCQDTVTLKLTINGGQHTDTLVTACKSYTWDRTGVEYTTTQDVDYIFTNAQGCQDTVTLKLTINGGQHTDTLVTACKSYTWDRTGVEYTTTQDVDYIFTNAQGCQDTVTLKLTINGGQHTDTLVTACKSYTWDRTGVEYTTTQDVDYIFTNAQGCQDTVTLKLTINGGQHTDTLVTACKSYTWDRTGVEYTTTQDVDYIFTNAQGCQDTVTLKLTINGGQHTDTLVTACKSYTWDRTGVEYTTTQDVDYIFTNAQGCQDTVTLKLTINGGQHTDTLVTACKSYTWDRTGVEYTTTQDVDYIFTNAQGCQDTVTLKLTINGGQHTDTLVTACKSYTWDRTGVEYTTTQDVDYIFTNAQGCQDTVTLHLTINNGQHTDTTATACGSFTWDRNGVTYTTTQTVDYITSNGQCQDTVTLHLTINNGQHTDTTATACGSFTWDRNGVTYTTTQTVDYITSNGQCQDTVTLHLTINNGQHTDTTATACGSFTWDRNGVTYTTTQTVDYITSNGQCQDTVTLHLTINNGQHTDTTATACGSFTWDRNGVTYTTTQTVDYITSNGQCQDTVTLHLTINNGQHTDTTATACGSFTWDRNGVTYTTTQTVDYITSNGQCQDTVTLHLTINNGQHTDTTATACGSFTWDRNGVTYTTTQTVDYITSNGQCQDTVTLHLTINNGQHTDTTATACGSFTWDRNGVTYTTTQTVDYITSNGQCQDTVTLHLTINNGQHTDTTATACGSFTWDRNGVTYTTTQTVDYITSNGQCQDTVTLHLTINNGQHTDTTATACGSFTWDRNGVTYTTTQTVDYITSNGQCQDTVTLHLTINNGQHTDTTATACGSFTWDRNGVTYTTTQTVDYITSNGQCQDTVTLHLTINNGQHTDTTATACGSFTWDRNGVTYTTTQTVDYITSNGQCQDTVTLHLTINNGQHTDTTATACGSFTWDRNGVTYTTTQTVDYITSNGQCQDTVTLHLTINNGQHTDTTATACGSFTWDRNGVTYTTTQTVDYITSNGQCQDTVTLHLTINNGQHTDTTATACGSFTWDRNGVTYTTTQTVDYITSNGQCQDTVTLHLTINNGQHTDTTATACGSFTWDRNGVTYTTTQTVDYITSNGQCQDTVTLHLTINNGQHTDTTATACGSFTWDRNGVTYTTTQTVDYITSNGQCQDTVTLHLTINNGQHTDTTATACGSFTWDRNGVTYTTTQTVDYITSNGQCQDTVTLHLTINNGQHTDTTATACGSFTWDRNGVTYTTTQTVDYITSNGQCQDTVTLHLTINNGQHTDTTATACGSFTWDRNGVTYTTTQTVDYITSNGQCQDTVTLHLTINNGQHTDTTATACGSFTWDRNGVTYTTTQTVDYITSNGQCQDTVTLHLTINNGQHTDTTATACGSFTWDRNGVTYTTTQTVDYITSNGQCQDTVTLHLTINNGQHTDTTATACGSFTWDRNGVTYTTTQTVDYITSNGQCQDTVTLHLTINNGQHTDTTATACGSFTWDRNGVTYTTTQTVDYITSNGQCQDTVTLHLTINNGQHTDTTATACGSFTWDRNGVTYTTTQTVDYITSNGQCQDTVTLHLTINNGQHTDTTATACGSFTWDRNGVTYTTTQTVDYITSNGQCQDTVTLHLTINNGQHTDTTATACGSFTWDRNGVTYTTTQTVDYITSNGQCQDTVTLHLTINNGQHTDTTATACGSFTWDRNGVTYTTTQTVDYITSNGQCQDTVTLHLTINNGQHTDTTATACGSFTWDRNGVTYTTTQTVDYITSNGQCQDTVTLHLTINNGQHTDTTATACGSFTWDRNGVTYTTTQTVDYITSNGQCQDTVTLHLTINNGQHTDTTATACGSFTWDRNGVTYTTTQTVDYITSNGQCQDTVTLHLTINQLTTSITTVTVCPNQLPYTWNGKQYTQAGTYTYITTNAAGCDSVASLVLEIAQVITGPTDNVTVCANSLPYTWNGQNIMQAGTYTATLQNTAGCDSVITLKLVTTPLATATVSGGNPICEGSSTTLAIALTGAAPWTVVYSDGVTNHVINNIDASPYELTVSPTTTTTYTLLSVTDAKCSNNSPNSTITITVQSQQSGIRYPNVTTTANTATPLQARNLGSNYSYQWNPPVGLNRTDVIDPVFNYDNSVQYTITLTPDNGCKVVDTVLVIMRDQGQLIRSDIFVPKAWSPNVDGHNDVLRPLCVNIAELYYFRVFDRWGQLMFETNQIGKGWNGIFNGKPQVQDVYTWTLEARGEDGKHYKRSGNSILMR